MEVLSWPGWLGMASFCLEFPLRGSYSKIQQNLQQ